MTRAKASLKRQWLSTRRHLLMQVKGRVDAYGGGLPAGAKSYQKAFEHEFRGPWQLASMAELVDCFHPGSLALAADFHAFAQSQRVHLRLLRQLPAGAKVVLALECLESRHQSAVDDFMDGKISEEKFLKVIDWDKRWGFPWKNYEPLFRLARDRQWQVCAINLHCEEQKLAGLRRRDQHVAKQLGKAHRRFSGHFIYCVFGEMHLAQRHLPAQLTGQIQKIIRIFQNSEALYFKMAALGKEQDAELLRRGSDKYCIQSSPPWVKWQSYLIYLEHSEDLSLQHEDGIPSEATDQIKEYTQLLMNDLQDSAPVNLDDLAVYSGGDDRVVLSFQSLAAPLKTLAREHVRAERSFYLPEAGFSYLSRASVNHAASLAGLYMQAKISGRRQSPWRFPEHLRALIYLEALGYFSSKLINHRRKCESLQDLQKQFESMKSKDSGWEIFKLILDTRLADVMRLKGQKLRHKGFKPKRPFSFCEAARSLGHIMGERLYRSFHNNEWSKADVLTLFAQDLFSADFDQQYYKFLSRVEKA
jgi:hypothetical protein